MRRPCSWMFRGLLVKVLSSDNLWTRWMGGGGTMEKHSSHPRRGFCIALIFFHSAQHLSPLVLSRGSAAEAREEEHCVRMCINAH